VAVISYIAHSERRAQLYARQATRRVADTWAGVYDSREDKWMSVLHLRAAEVYVCVVLSAFALAGVILALRRNAVDALPVALCVVVFPVPYYLTHTSWAIATPSTQG